MSTPITPLKAPALADLLNALQLAVTYGDKEIPDAEAKQALGRIRGLIATALAKLGEPNEAAVSEALVLIRCLPAYAALWTMDVTEREARDIAAVVLHAALTGEVASESGDFGASLPCPQCHGDGQVGMHRDGQPIVCDQCKGSGIPR